LTAQRPVVAAGAAAPGLSSARPAVAGSPGSATPPASGTIKLTRPMLKAATPPPVEEELKPDTEVVEPPAEPAAETIATKTVMINLTPAEPAIKPPAPVAEQSTIKLVRKPIPGMAKPAQPGVQAAAAAAKKETSKISLDQAVPTPGGKLPPVGYARLTDEVSATNAPAVPGLPLLKKPAMNMATISNAMSNTQSNDALLTEKRKTSRISLEAVLAAETSEVKKNPTAPTTIRLKKPTDSAGIKIGAPKDLAVPPPTIAMNQTAKLDEAAEDAPTATKKKTIKIKKPGGGFSMDGDRSAASAGGSGSLSPGAGRISAGGSAAAYKEGTGSKVFSAISLVMTAAALVVISITIYMFTAQVSGVNYCMTITSDYPTGPNLSWGNKLMPGQ
jgi:hypothetical protein